MDEQKRLLLALALIALVVVAMTYLWPAPTGEQAGGQQPTPAEQIAETDAGDREEPAEPAEEHAEQGEEHGEEPRTREMFPEKRLTLRNDSLIVEIDSWGGGLVKAELQDEQFRTGRGDEVRQLDLVSINVEERPELTPLVFQLVRKGRSAPTHSESAEGQGVLRMLNQGGITGEWLQLNAEIGEAFASRLVGRRPYATLESVEEALDGSKAQKRETLAKLLSTAWRENYVRLDFEVLSHDEESQVVLRGTTEDQIEVVRTVTLAGDYEVRVRDRIKNVGERRQHVRERLITTGLEERSGGGGCFTRPTGLLAGLCLHGDDIVRRNRDRLAGDSGGCMGMGCGGPPGADSRSGMIRFVAVDEHFFMTALSPSHAREGGWGDTTCHLSAESSGELTVSIEPVVFTELPSGETATYVATMYMGPKQYNLLKNVGAGRRLWEAIDYGWFAALSHVLLRALRLFHGWLGNWGLAIILLTFLIKTILLPVSHKTFKSMREMQREIALIKPELDEINEKYKDNYETKQAKTLELYNKAGISPLKQAAGCLPMFLQMPIWIGLYRMISESVELYRAPFFWWLDDLSAQDPYYILPGLLGASMFIQQMITPSPGMDNQQQKMMKWMMPGMFLLIMLNMPSGLVLYIFVNTLLTIAQQQFINRTIPTTPMPTGGKKSESKSQNSASETTVGKTDGARSKKRAKSKSKSRKRK